MFDIRSSVIIFNTNVVATVVVVVTIVRLLESVRLVTVQFNTGNTRTVRQPRYRMQTTVADNFIPILSDCAIT